MIKARPQRVNTNYSENANIMTKNPLGLRGGLARGKVKLLRVVPMFTILIVVIVSLVYPWVRTHQTAHFKWMHIAGKS